MRNNNDRIRQGDIYWVDYVAPGFDCPKTRPCVVVSATIYNKEGSDVIVCPLSGSVTRTDLPCNIYIGEPVDGPAWVKTNQMQTVTYNQLKPESRCGGISSSDILRVTWGIMRQIALVDEQMIANDLKRVSENEAIMLNEYQDGDEAATYPVEV